MSKPGLTAKSSPAPTKLVIDDLTVGDGREAVPGTRVKVRYMGIDYETSGEFDSSWSRGQSIEFPLDDLIADWQESVPGMRVGGRRKLIYPPEKAYGPVSAEHFLSGKALVFVTDLLNVK